MSEKIRLRPGDSVTVHGMKMEVGQPVAMMTLSGARVEFGVAGTEDTVLVHSDAELVTRKLGTDILSWRNLHRALRPGNAILATADDTPRLIVSSHKSDCRVVVWPGPTRDIPASPYSIIEPQLRIEGRVTVADFSHRDGGPPIEGEPAKIRLDYEAWPTLSYGADDQFVEISVPPLRRDRVLRIPLRLIWRWITHLWRWRYPDLVGEEVEWFEDFVPGEIRVRWPNDEGILTSGPCKKCRLDGYDTLLMRVGWWTVVCLACSRRYKHGPKRGVSLTDSMLYVSVTPESGRGGKSDEAKQVTPRAPQFSATD